MDATQEGASRCVGISRHCGRGNFTAAEEAVLRHGTHWPINPQMVATREGASRCVGTCRHNGQGNVPVANEAMLCHVAHWLEWPEINPLRTTSHKLPESIQHRQKIAGEPTAWDLASEDTNDILARWNREENNPQEEHPWLSSPENWTSVPHSSAEHLPHRSCGTCLGQSQSSWSRKHRATTQKKLKRSHPRVTNILAEQKLSLAHSVGWTMKSPPHICTGNRCLSKTSKAFPGSKRPRKWTFPFLDQCGRNFGGADRPISRFLL